MRVIVDVFSGRENPVIEVGGAEEREVLARMRPRTRGARAALDSAEIPALGYRGLIVEQTRERIPSLPKRFRFVGGFVGVRNAVRVAEDESAEELIFGPGGPAERARLDRRVLSFVRQQVKNLPELRARMTASAAEATDAARVTAREAAIVQGCLCGPIFEPAWWNDGGRKQLQNNCYNYATNYRTDTFAQPGRANGRFITSLNCTCAVVRPFAILDSLIDAPNANNECPPVGHLVALVMAPRFDFHWYRKGEDGMWTHKIGPAPVTALDNAGNLITDPRVADRGPYIDFCGFMVVMHGHIRLQ